MPNSEGISSKAKKNKSDNFVWSEDEVELLLLLFCDTKRHEWRRIFTSRLAKQNMLTFYTYSVHIC